ncbi:MULTISPECIES: dTDP-4-dehydrorhamnose reductase [Dyella]|uniref:dTDP-4-dehydrorhamnose reductase n=2 Tax=Dyella TaxID=231454 RepID=A0A4V2NM59_9GAMM|nr:MULTISPECIES: dTDP-4-dehydrorhamnose reductase [Dyella]TBR40370.1 dTDP-4-dehydrorhamnose reductase [Dyella terrae]TCI12047.1 dTDP-4-dehydrorhamnose reductase [Dyella soli]
MKALLLGANGQLGQNLAAHPRLASLGEVILATRDGQLSNGASAETADLSRPESLTAVLDRISPDVIINAAAYTAVDRAETEEDLATRVNGEAVGVLGQWAAGRGIPVVHFSTDYVFDGEGTRPYLPDDPTSPLGAYGRSKRAGERALQHSGVAHLIFRTAWVYAPWGHNFLRTMLRLAADRDELRVVADQVGAPTTTTLIADGAMLALEHWLAADQDTRRGLEGVHHLVAGGETSWHGFASAIVQQAHERGILARCPRVTAIGTNEFPTPARRPRYSVLDASGFERTFGMLLPSWQQGLDGVLATLALQRK